jgi:hypothetical protein
MVSVVVDPVPYLCFILGDFLEYSVKGSCSFC